MLYLLQKTTHKLITILCIVVFFMGSKVFATHQIDIGYGAIHPPFVYKKDGVLTGIDVDILALVLAQQEYTPRFYLMPWARAIKEVKQGRLGGVLTVYCEESSPHVLTSNEAVYSTRLSIFALKKIITL